jgi:hypothetical protein
MRVGLCGGTTPYADALARQVSAITGPPSKPLTTVDSSTATDDGKSRAGTIALGAGGLLVLVAIAAFVIRRRA